MFLFERFNNLKLIKKLSMHIPEDISEMIANKNLSELMTASSTHRPTTTSDGKQTSRRRLLAPQQTETPSSTSNSLNLNFYNSVVVVSIASAILVVFGLACFSISMLLYFTSKCGRKRRAEKKKRREPQNSGGDFMSSSETKIVVYDMPSAAAALKESNNQKQTVYSLASTLSSTSECGDTSASSSSTTNNISPVTTTTTSIQGSSSNAPGSCSAAGPLFQTHLETTAHTNVLTTSLSNMQSQLPLPPNLPDLPKSNIFDWFMEQNAQSCEFSRVNHIK